MAGFYYYSLFIWNVFTILHCAALTRYYLEDRCDRTLNMTELQIPAGRLFDSRQHKYQNRMSCQVTIQAPKDRQVMVVFRELAIEWESNCDDDFITLYDGENVNAPLVKDTFKHMCGHQIPQGSFASTGSAMTVYFRTDPHKQDNGFELIFTAFHSSAPCVQNEFQCDNGRCIADSLTCNNFDNCGDESDECHINSEVMMAIVLSVFLLTVFGVGGITIYKKQARLKSPKKKKIKDQLPDIFQSITLQPCSSDADMRLDDTRFVYQSEATNSPEPPARRKWKPAQMDTMEIWLTLTEDVTSTGATGGMYTQHSSCSSLGHKRASF